MAIALAILGTACIDEFAGETEVAQQTSAAAGTPAAICSTLIEVKDVTGTRVGTQTLNATLNVRDAPAGCTGEISWTLKSGNTFVDDGDFNFFFSGGNKIVIKPLAIRGTPFPPSLKLTMCVETTGGTSCKTSPTF